MLQSCMSAQPAMQADKWSVVAQRGFFASPRFCLDWHLLSLYTYVSESAWHGLCLLYALPVCMAGYPLQVAPSMAAAQSRALQPRRRGRTRLRSPRQAPALESVSGLPRRDVSCFVRVVLSLGVEQALRSCNNAAQITAWQLALRAGSMRPASMESQ